MDADKQKAISNVHPYLQHQLERTMETAARSFKFVVGSEIRHVKSGGMYIVLGTPNEYVIETTREPAYAYLMPDGRICVRSQAETEDGRFEDAEVGAALVWYNTPGNYDAWLAKAGPAQEASTSTPEPVLHQSAISFDQFLQHGRENSTSLVDGMPWAFVYKNHPVTHCDDDTYFLSRPDGSTLLFQRGDTLVEVDDRLHVVSPTDNASYLSP